MALEWTTKETHERTADSHYASNADFTGMGQNREGASSAAATSHGPDRRHLY